jgi:hypothetical protein
VRLWKLELQRLANELDILIEVHHLPPETSKWNKIEHRLFSFITQNWRPNRWSVIASSLICSRRRPPKLGSLCELHDKSYPKGSLKIKRADLHTIRLPIAQKGCFQTTP